MIFPWRDFFLALIAFASLIIAAALCEIAWPNGIPLS